MEAHLDEPLDVRTLARVAAYSEFHFHRVFRAITGDTAKSYLRRLLLERAARELRQSEHKVVEIALRAGFEAHEAFTRAFTAQFGVPPRAYRSAHQHRATELAGPEADFAHVESRAALALWGRRHVGEYAAVGGTWQALFELCGQHGLAPRATIGLCWDDPEVTPADAFRYDACVALEHPPPQGTGLVVHTLGPGRFAVAIHRGGYEHIGQSYAQVMRWALERDFTLSTEPTLEHYQIGPGAAAPDAYRTEIAWRLAESV